MPTSYEATFEATFCTAILNAEKTGNNRPSFTLLRGGVFGNKIEWIIEAMERAARLHYEHDLEVSRVSYLSSKEDFQRLVKRLPEH